MLSFSHFNFKWWFIVPVNSFYVTDIKSSNNRSKTNIDNAPIDVSSIKLLSAKIVSMEKQISENSNQFSINIKNLDESVSLFRAKVGQKYCEYIHLSYSSAMKHDIESRCWKIVAYLLIEQFCQAISLERRQSSNKPPSSSISNKPPRWIRCIGCFGTLLDIIGHIARKDQEKNKQFRAENASR
ncbi:19817_t:CDS:2, partial [Cetraspora pellucida]